MAIHWSLDHLEKLLPPELFAKLSTASCNPAVSIDAGGNYPIIQGETGDLLAGVPYARGLRVPRSKMRALCAEGIDVQVCGVSPAATTSLVVYSICFPKSMFILTVPLSFASTARASATLLSTRAATE